MIDERRASGGSDRSGFRAPLLAGSRADIQVIADGRNSNTAGTALNYVERDRRFFNADWRTLTAVPAGAPSSTTRAWYNPNLETRWNMVPA